MTTNAKSIGEIEQGLTNNLRRKYFLRRLGDKFAVLLPQTLLTLADKMIKKRALLMGGFFHLIKKNLFYVQLRHSNRSAYRFKKPGIPLRF
ncbi:MAG: hypothetical protein AVDCRST_MAG96-2526 [uncultured Segetibacter sp.]|uniref:Uncharacterized protein n=1 Tax=uncultured Segetibacter sp. TaxID=481133 RepID=A0A6J4T2R9_9BACT|nr:MAG: hypothetical protein AVDCRST_MAG96-2526 [uncultured Segetibacter sp.]